MSWVCHLSEELLGGRDLAWPVHTESQHLQQGLARDRSPKMPADLKIKQFYLTRLQRKLKKKMYAGSTRHKETI